MAISRFEDLVGAVEAQKKLVAADQQLFMPGDECEYYVFVRSGLVRVELLSSKGQNLLLYRIADGQSCVMTTACLLGANRYHAHAITETQVELILLPQNAFRAKLAESSAFRDHVFNGFSERLAALMQRTAELATHTVDQRLAAALLARAETASQGAVIALTHEQLAIDIGSAREVVSRRLAAFEKQGVVARHRGGIEILQTETLAEYLAP